jgi:pimeloyl-ACP methyl ester carboxylesterase
VILRRATIVLAVLVAPALAAQPAQALDLRTCRSDSAFVCGALRVPLDHSGRVRGTLSLDVAAERRRGGRKGLLIALSGGPGQSSVSAAGSFADVLAPLLGRYRLAVIDQRGTGRGALQCPSFQRLGSLEPYSPQGVLACAKRVGSRRSFFSTGDSVDDLEAMRRAFGVPRLALMGISYGTWVAQEYARRYPRRVDRLILDSVVGPGASDPFFLDTYRRIPRVLAEQCAGRRCARATTHPVADLGAVARRLRTGPLRGTTYSPRGRGRRTALVSEEQLAYLITAGDVNPFLRARLPGALAAAARGDVQPLLRTRRIAEGPPTPSRDFSSALNLVTGCLDAQLPFPLSSAPEDRPALVAAALAKVPPSDYDPWSSQAVLHSAYADDCLLFPRQSPPRRNTRALPDVPALILSGRLDMRTPAENGRAVARLLPRARVVEVPGNGHDQLDTDVTGCIMVALERWIAGRRVGSPCKGTGNQVEVLPRPPRALSELGPTRQVPGRRGSVALAALETAREVHFAAYEAVFAGLDARGGGLRGGSFAATDPFDGVVALRAYEHVPGVRLSGRLSFGAGRVRGEVRVAGAASGRLRIDTRSGVTGVLDGRAVRYRRPPGRGAGTATAAASAARVLRRVLDSPPPVP